MGWTSLTRILLHDAKHPRASAAFTTRPIDSFELYERAGIIIIIVKIRFPTRFPEADFLNGYFLE